MTWSELESAWSEVGPTWSTIVLDGPVGIIDMADAP